MADDDADLVEMLRAMLPGFPDDLYADILSGAVNYQIGRNGARNILAWANARRDAAVREKTIPLLFDVGDRDATIARLREGIEAATVDPGENYRFGLRCGVEDRLITDRYEAAEYGWDQAFDYIRSALPEVGPEPTPPAPLNPLLHLEPCQITRLPGGLHIACSGTAQMDAIVAALGGV